MYRKIKWTTINRYPADDIVNTDSAIRIYRSDPSLATLQVRGPLRKNNGRTGAFGVIASAKLNRDELTQLRDGINKALESLQS